MAAELTIEEYLRSVPTDEETARCAVAPWREMDSAARLDALAALLRGMDDLLCGRMPLRSPDDLAFWRHWGDPDVGRPR